MEVIFFVLEEFICVDLFVELVIEVVLPSFGFQFF